MAVEDILNYRKIDERIATGGQPSGEQLAAIHAAGYQAVINLAPHSAENNALAGEAAMLRALGVEYIHIPVAWTNPTHEDFQGFCAAMAALETRKTFIHCAANFRVTAFYALYALKFEHWPQDQADALIASVWHSRPDYTMDDVWQAFIAAGASC